MYESAMNDHSPAPSLPSPYDATQFASPAESAMQDRQRQKWANILALTRRLIVESRFTGFTVKHLANLSGLSTQALHNRFGTRSGVLSAAINDYSLALFQYGRDCQLGRNPVLSFAEAYAQACAAYPEFHQKIVPNTFFDRKGAQIFERTHGYGTALIHRALASMRRSSRIRAQADLRIAATAISAVMGTTILEWTRGTLGTKELHHQMTYGVELLFIGLEPIEH